jgi:Nidogen-like
MNTLSRESTFFTKSAKSQSSFHIKVIGFAVTSLAMSLAMTGVASAAAIRTGFSGSTLAANDDGSAGPVALGFTANFFGTEYTQTYVNNNGNLTFGAASGTYTPSGLAGINTPIVAAFFADVDTRGTGSSPVTYGTGTVNGRAAFGANYVNVGYYDSQTNKLNDFQLLLIDRSDTGAGNFDIEYNYNKIQWETGGASGGTNGLGGTSAAVGYSNGSSTNRNYAELPGSLVNGALLDGGSNSLVANSLNSDGVAGRYTFNARNGAVVTPPTTSVPEPFTIVGTLMGGAAALRMRKRLKVTNKL